MSNKLIYHNQKIFKIILQSGIDRKIYFGNYNEILTSKKYQ